VAVGPAPVADVRRHLRTFLSRAKQPVRYHQVGAIPKTPYGKIDRVAVKRLVAELEQDGSPAAPLGRE
jgi:acyl-coenzyme A synthetase/AMP-(fatty) acid ligase